MSNEVESEKGIEAKELSFWEKAVGYTFNPSGYSKVYQAKRLFATLIDLVNPEDAPNGTYMGNLLKWMATRSCITAQMAVVKFLTWKD